MIRCACKRTSILAARPSRQLASEKDCNLRQSHDERLSGLRGHAKGLRFRGALRSNRYSKFLVYEVCGFIRGILRGGLCITHSLLRVALCFLRGALDFKLVRTHDVANALL